VSASASNRGYARLALAALARSAPARYAALVAGVTAVPGVYRIGGETFTISVREGNVVVGDAAVTPLLDVAIRPDDLVRLIDGTATLRTLLAQERVRVFAAPKVLLDAAELIASVFDGEVLRGRALRDLFEDYRRCVSAGRLRG
jgi:hypothetical protein